jgi:hypothetical protein
MEKTLTEDKSLSMLLDHKKSATTDNCLKKIARQIRRKADRGDFLIEK